MKIISIKSFPQIKYLSFIFIILATSAIFDKQSVYGADGPIISKTEKILVSIHPYKRATLSAEVPGVVKKIVKEMGGIFSKGDQLISLDSGLYEADQKKNIVLFNAATTIYKINLKLYQQKSVSEIELTKAKSDLEAARVNKAIANKKLSGCSIKAPYDGRVVRLHINENEWVEPGKFLIEIIDDRIMRAQFRTPLSYLKYVQTGQELDVKIDGVPEDLKCKITHISPVMESNTATFQVFGEIDNSKNLLRSGMTGEIVLILDKKETKADPHETYTDDHTDVSDSDMDGVLDDMDKCPDTPVSAEIDDRGCWTIKELTFESNKWEILPQYYTSIDKIALLLENKPEIRIEIQGHTDSSGDSTVNQVLSENRAKAIMKYLVLKRINPSRLSVKGFGDTAPIVSNATSEGRKQNRRVEIKPISE